jgi:hypothetical protein
VSELPRASTQRPHPVTGAPVTFRFAASDDAAAAGHDVWIVHCAGRALGVVVRPYSVLDDPPPTYVALPVGVTGLMAGLWAGSWPEALAHLEAAARVGA